MILSTLCMAELVAAAEEVTLGFIIEAVANGGPPAAVIDEIVVIEDGIAWADGNFDTSWISRSTQFV